MTAHSQDRSAGIAFGSFSLYPAERRLDKEGQPVRIGSRALDLLIFLAERPGEVLPNHVLLKSVWGTVHVEEGSLRFHIKNLRDVLVEDGSETSYVTNVPGRGYCFTARVQPIERNDARVPPNALRAFRANLTGPNLTGPNLPGANLPQHTGRMLGRDEAVAAVSQELLRSRLVTIAGTAGVGKTTLAVAAAESVRTSFDVMVVFIDLAPINDGTLVASAIAAALGVAAADDPSAAIVNVLRGKRILLLLDNCEQVVDAVASLVERVLQHTAEVRVLATSRETLRIAEERVYRLPPLACPPATPNMSAQEAMTFSAVQLFVRRTAAAVDDFQLLDSMVADVAEICRRLDGVPLAIELAAAHVEFLGITDLAKRLNDMFSLLTHGRRLATKRHQTLRATLDWSYNLLAHSEQLMLQRLGVFRASFTLEAALAVAVAPPLREADAVEALAGLAVKSLLSVQDQDGTTRYRLLETTRLYAGSKLAPTNDAGPAARRHASYQLKRMQDAGGNWQSNAGWLDDLRAALDWSFSPSGDTELGIALTAYSSALWFGLSLLQEYWNRIELALRKLLHVPQTDPAWELHLQMALGHVLWYLAVKPNSMELAFSRGLQLARQAGDVPAELQALWGQWASQRARGQYRKALAIATDYQSIAKAAGDDAFIILGDRILGLTNHYLGQYSTARCQLERVERAIQGRENVPNTGLQLSPQVATATMLTRILWLQGSPEQARRCLQAGIDAAHRSNHQYSLFYMLGFAGCPYSLWTGDLAETQRHLDVMADCAAGNPALERWRQSWALILRLRHGSEGDALIAATLEPRLDISTVQEISQLAEASALAVPQPADDHGDILWNTPEVWRVNAELALWHGGDQAAADAEATLLKALALAREQSALAWELRSATSLARLRHRRGRQAEARELLATTIARFTEGFDTADLRTARRLLDAFA